MKNNRFAIINIWLICIGLLLASCKKDTDMGVSLNDIIIEAIPTEPVTFDISGNVAWTIEVIQEEIWLTVSPLQGKGKERITVEATENDDFTERIAFIVISGEGMENDTIRVFQEPCLDIAEKIKDEIFKQYCLNAFDHSPNDGRISAKEALKAVDIIVKGMEISSLAGIEYFTNIRKLVFSANNVEEIDVSKNKVLRILDCSFNPITKIDVSELSKLEDLHLHSTDIRSIDVSKNAELYLLTTSNSPITALDVSENSALGMLLCNDNQLISLDISKNTNLLMLQCGNNRLSTINTSMNTNLRNLWCNNQTDGNGRKILNSIDVRNNKALQSLSCSQNNISSLNLTNSPELRELRCDDNQLTALDLRINEELEDLRCNNNNLTGSIDISYNKKLKFIDLQRNNLDSIYVWRGFDKDCTFSADGKIKCYEKDENTQWVVK